MSSICPGSVFQPGPETKIWRAEMSPAGIDSHDILCDRRRVKPGGKPAAAPVASSCGDLLPADASIREGDLLWAPSPEQAARANVTGFTGWLAAERGLRFADYDALWRWSVTDLDGFWQAVWDYSGIQASAPPAAVLGRRAMPGAEWFPGARLNYAEHVLRSERPGQDALLAAGESAPLTAVPLRT